MPEKSFLDGKVVLHCGDCLKVMETLQEGSIDAIVCDPPYHLHSIVKRFSKTGRTDSTRTKSGPHQRTATGFMNKVWDGGDIAFQVATWERCLRVLKPGGYIVAFSSSRTFGRMSVAIEDAGFITHPMIGWIFGSGFPKAHSAAMAIDRELGVAGERVAVGNEVRRIRPGADQNKDGSWEKLEDRTYQPGSYVPASREAEQWSGWAYGGQSLKPALEPIYLGQKPFSEKNGARNLMKHGVGAMNIDGCRVDAADGVPVFSSRGETRTESMGGGLNGSNRTGDVGNGRWPANLIHDGSDEVLACFPDSNGQQGDVSHSAPSERTANVYGKMRRYGEASAEKRYTDVGATNFSALPGQRRLDSGSAARFFYAAKAGPEDRLGSKHPTVKPQSLMQYLVRMVTPRGGVVLDPFAGTGSTGEAAWREGMRAVLIERESEYQADIARRLELAANPTKKAAVIKAAKAGLDVPDDLPLFALDGGDA